MLNKKKLSIATISLFLLGLLAVNLVMAATPIASLTKPISSVEVSADKPSAIAVTTVETPEKIEKLKSLIPETPEKAITAIYPSRTRFLLWTNDGLHIMWGTYGNGVFIGTDNLGKRCWGIYGRGIFAGFYDGQFFWGRYSNGAWRARYLFGLEYSYGKYVLFRSPTLSAESP